GGAGRLARRTAGLARSSRPSPAVLTRRGVCATVRASTGPPCPPLLGDAPAQPGRPSISLRRPGASTGPPCPPLLGDAPAQPGRPPISLRRPGAPTGPPRPPLPGRPPAPPRPPPPSPSLPPS